MTGCRTANAQKETKDIADTFAAAMTKRIDIPARAAPTMRHG